MNDSDLCFFSAFEWDSHIYKWILCSSHGHTAYFSIHSSAFSFWSLYMGNYDSKTNYQKIILTVALRILILIDFVRTYGYLPSTMGQYPQNTNSTERQSSLVSPQEKMYISQFCWLGSLFLCCSF